MQVNINYEICTITGVYNPEKRDGEHIGLGARRSDARERYLPCLSTQPFIIVTDGKPW